MLFETEGVKLEFTDNAISTIAKLSLMMNEQSENIGARRLHTVLEKLLEDISFDLPNDDLKEVIVDEDFVNGKFADSIHAYDVNKKIEFRKIKFRADNASNANANRTTA